METITLKPGQAVYDQQQIDNMIDKLQRLEDADRDQKILINQANTVVELITNMFPGLKDGNMSSFNPMQIMQMVNGNSKLVDEFKKLIPLIDEYKKRNPVLMIKN